MNYMVNSRLASDSVNDRIREAKETRTLRRIKETPLVAENPVIQEIKKVTEGKPAGTPLLVALSS